MSGTLTACDSSAMANVPLVRAVTAVIIGRAMPSSEPKAMRMMIAAAMMPKISLLAGGRRLTSATALPLSSTCRPGCRAVSAMLMTCLMSCIGRFWARPVRSTVANAVLPSGLIWAVPVAS
jgi:hypothetical protein